VAAVLAATTSYREETWQCGRSTSSGCSTWDLSFYFNFVANFCDTTGDHCNRWKILQRAEVYKELFAVNDGGRKTERTRSYVHKQRHQSELRKSHWRVRQIQSSSFICVILNPSQFFLCCHGDDMIHDWLHIMWKMKLEYKWLFYLPVSCRLPGEAGVTNCIMSKTVYRFLFKIFQPVENLDYFIHTLFMPFLSHLLSCGIKIMYIKFKKMLQLLGDEVPQTPYRGFAPGPHWGTFVPQTPRFWPPLYQILNTPLSRDVRDRDVQVTRPRRWLRRSSKVYIVCSHFIW